MRATTSVFSFFSGAGFLDLGFEQAGFNISFVNEVYPPFLDAYRYSRRLLGLEEPEYGYYLGGIEELVTGPSAAHLSSLIRDARNQYDVIGFIGGPPCPDFSVGGKNRGKEGENGILSATYVELICQQRPDFFLFENVKGLLRTKKHRQFFEELKRKLRENDYYIAERLINSIEYGVPQDRERIIMIGFRGDFVGAMGILTPAAFEDGFPWEEHIVYPREKVFAYPWPRTDIFEEDSCRPEPQGVPIAITVEHWFQRNDVYHHPNAVQFFRPRAALDRFKTIEEGDVSRKSFKRLHRWRYSPTACYGNNEVHLHPYKARRLTVAEALAVQSLPKQFVLPLDMTLTDAFKTIGNGVPYLASLAMAETLKTFFEVHGHGLVNRFEPDRAVV
jgi:DNA (cytosine-5)-methyltransferase 1